MRMETRVDTEQDLERLIGQFESVRLDFKASALLDQPKDRIVKQLAEDVSSFANTEGGIIVIGIREGKSGKKSIATEIDTGCDPAKVSPDWLEQLIASNISPPIPGLTVKPIPLSGSRNGRVAFVITVPKGITAYQATHSHRYYGRSEFAAVPLHDSFIRLLMVRGRVPKASLEIAKYELLTAEQELARRQARHDSIRKKRKEGIVVYGRGVPSRDYFNGPKRDYDELSFRLTVVNIGEITIRDFLLSLTFTTDFKFYHLKSPTDQIEVTPGETFRFRFADGKSTFGGGREYFPPEKAIFPQDRVLFPSDEWYLHLPAREPMESCTALLRWSIYLDNAPASFGDIAFSEHFKTS